MTSNSGTQRFVVVAASDPPDPRTLATAIYDQYLDPENAAATDDETEADAISDADPIKDAPISVSSIQNPATTPSLDHRQTLQLPTLPHQPSLQPPTHAVATPENLPLQYPSDSPTSTSPLSDEERTLLRETLHGKLPDDTVQQLLQQMEQVSPHPPPLPQRTVSRYRLAAGIALVILLGVGSSLWLNRLQGKGLVLENAPTATPSVASIATPPVAPPPQLDATVAARNDALDKALKESDTQQTAIDAARRDFLLEQAQIETQAKGTPIQVWLIRRLNAQVLELRRTVGKGGEFSGNAQQIAIARALVGDSKATLLALQAGLNDTAQDAPLRHRVAPALLTKTMSDLAELTRLIREADYEQQLHNEEQDRQNTKEGKPHGIALPTH